MEEENSGKLLLHPPSTKSTNGRAEPHLKLVLSSINDNSKNDIAVELQIIPP